MEAGRQLGISLSRARYHFNVVRIPRLPRNKILPGFRCVGLAAYRTMLYKQAKGTRIARLSDKACANRMIIDVPCFQSSYSLSILCSLFCKFCRPRRLFVEVVRLNGLAWKQSFLLCSAEQMQSKSLYRVGPMGWSAISGRKVRENILYLRSESQKEREKLRLGGMPSLPLNGVVPW